MLVSVCALQHAQCTRKNKIRITIPSHMANDLAPFSTPGQLTKEDGESVRYHSHFTPRAHVARSHSNDSIPTTPCPFTHRSMDPPCAHHSSPSPSLPSNHRQPIAVIIAQRSNRVQQAPSPLALPFDPSLAPSFSLPFVRPCSASCAPELTNKSTV